MEDKLMDKKYLIKVANWWFEVTKEEYDAMKADKNRHTYLKENQKVVKIVSLESLKNDAVRGMDFIVDPNANVEAEVITKLENERLWRVLQTLSQEDMYIVTEYLMKPKEERKTLTEIGKTLGMSHTAVRKRKLKIIEYLREIL